MRRRAGRLGLVASAAALSLIVSGCEAAGLSMSTGPSRSAIQHAPENGQVPGLRIIDVTDEAARQSSQPMVEGNFAQVLGEATPIGTRVGVGDVLEVTIWEAAPAALFGGGNLDTSIGSSVQPSRASTLPHVQVGPSGVITIPFAGDVPAAGRTLHDIENEIVARLRGKAHLPQVTVRVAENVTANVTVLGDVKQPMRVPLTPRGERLLDAIAKAGGSSQPLDRMTIQVTRGGVVQRMTAQDLVRDPRQNIVLKSDDVVTLFYQPYSFTVLGAAGKNDEVRFEGLGLTLSQALGRIGGLADDRADPKGVFIFRWENPVVVGAAPATGPVAAVPVVYRADMKNPQTFFAAQHFRIHDRDVIYVSNSRLSDIQRFVNVIASSILPVATVSTVVNSGL